MTSKNIAAPDGFEAWMLAIRCLASPQTDTAVREDMSRAYVVHILDYRSRQLAREIEARKPQTEDSLTTLFMDIVPVVSSDEELRYMREKKVAETMIQVLNSDGVPMEPFTAKTVKNGANKAYALLEQYGDNLQIK